MFRYRNGAQAYLAPLGNRFSYHSFLFPHIVYGTSYFYYRLCWNTLFETLLYRSTPPVFVTYYQKEIKRMNRNFNPEEGMENTGPENEGMNQEGLQQDGGQHEQRLPRKDKKRGKKAFAGEEENPDTENVGEEQNEASGEWEQRGADEEEFEEEGEDEEFEGEGETEDEEEYEEVESFIEEQIDAIGERVKNYIMKSSDTKKMKDLVKYGSLAALAVYGLRRGGLLRGLVISAAVSMAAKHLMAENGKEATA